MSKITSSLLKNKFRGSLLGSLLGDCLGSPFEGDVITSGEKIVIQRYFDQLESTNLKGPIREYTDDTAMMKSVAKCLVDKPEIDYNYMAKLFVKEYFSEPNRGYGQNVVEVFKKLRKNKYQDIFKPAQEQFDGSGSHGNGGAMRIAPIAIYFYNNYDAMIEAARTSTRITHTNLLGVHGAIFQAIAIRQALLHDCKDPINPQEFCDEICNRMKVIEKENDDGLDLGDSTPYQDKLKGIKRLLDTEYHDELDEEVIKYLGNSISAYDSVPTALYCFLRALNEIPTVNLNILQTSNIFRRTIQYAITLGGDADTIACMAGAIAGAYLGEEAINTHMMKRCEYHKEILELADNMYDAVVK